MLHYLENVCKEKGTLVCEVDELTMMVKDLQCMHA